MAEHIAKAATALQHDLFAQKEIEADLAEIFLGSSRSTVAAVAK
jgi:hypothetical protein